MNTSPPKRPSTHDIMTHLPGEQHIHVVGSISVIVEDEHLLPKDERNLIALINSSRQFDLTLDSRGTLFIAPEGRPSLPVPYDASRLHRERDGTHLDTTYAGHSADVRFYHLHGSTRYRASPATAQIKIE